MGLRISLEEAQRRGWVDSDGATTGATATRAPDAAAPEEPKKRVDREGPEQIAVIEWFEAQYPAFGSFLMHIPNGGKRTRFEAFHFVKEGVRKGVPDLFLPLPRHGYHGLWIEMKAPPGFSSSLSADQKEWLERLYRQGFAVAVSHGREPAITLLGGYMRNAFSMHSLLWTPDGKPEQPR